MKKEWTNPELLTYGEFTALTLGCPAGKLNNAPGDGCYVGTQEFGYTVGGPSN